MLPPVVTLQIEGPINYERDISFLYTATDVVGEASEEEILSLVTNQRSSLYALQFVSPDRRCGVFVAVEVGAEKEVFLGRRLHEAAWATLRDIDLLQVFGDLGHLQRIRVLFSAVCTLSDDEVEPVIIS